jgi:hypothetical protein
MDLSVTMPLDSDGFLRRECPNCEEQFKWHHGPANEEAESMPSPPAYYCPLCGMPADMDSWWTKEQLDYATGTAMPAVMREVERELKDTFKSTRNSLLRFEVKGSDHAEVPAALTELDDMQIVASPCHSHEPIKVPDDLPGPFHCLVCGQPFAV